MEYILRNVRFTKTNGCLDGHLPWMSLTLLVKYLISFHSLKFLCISDNRKLVSEYINWIHFKIHLFLIIFFLLKKTATATKLQNKEKKILLWEIVLYWNTLHNVQYISHNKASFRKEIKLEHKKLKLKRGGLTPWPWTITNINNKSSHQTIKKYYFADDTTSYSSLYAIVFHRRNVTSPQTHGHFN